MSNSRRPRAWMLVFPRKHSIETFMSHALHRAGPATTIAENRILHVDDLKRGGFHVAGPEGKIESCIPADDDDDDDDCVVGEEGI